MEGQYVHEMTPVIVLIWNKERVHKNISEIQTTNNVIYTQPKILFQI